MIEWRELPYKPGENLEENDYLILVNKDYIITATHDAANGWFYRSSNDSMVIYPYNVVSHYADFNWPIQERDVLKEDIDYLRQKVSDPSSGYGDKRKAKALEARRERDSLQEANTAMREAAETLIDQYAKRRESATFLAGQTDSTEQKYRCLGKSEAYGTIKTELESFLSRHTEGGKID